MKMVLLIIVSFFWSFNVMAQKVGECISGNCENGKGTKQLEKGDRYIGEFKNGVMDGIGKIVSKKGEYENAGLFSNGSPVIDVHFDKNDNDIKLFFRTKTNGSNDVEYSFNDYTGKAVEFIDVTYTAVQKDREYIDYQKSLKTTEYHLNFSTDRILTYEGTVVNGEKDGYGFEVKHVELKTRNQPSVFYWEAYEGQFKNGKRNGLGHKIKRNRKQYDIGEYKDGELVKEKSKVDPNW
jgi:hypothetical protein